MAEGCEGPDPDASPRLREPLWRRGLKEAACRCDDFYRQVFTITARSTAGEARRCGIGRVVMVNPGWAGAGW